jgi:hypothetical protein
MLKKKVGVLSTRSPHRPNPIGITLAKIEKVDKRTRCLHVSSCDLVHDTPILDIKPYVPNYDSIKDARVPAWIEESIDTRNTVTIAPGVKDKAERLLKKYCKLYKKCEDVFWKGTTLKYISNLLVSALPTCIIVLLLTCQYMLTHTPCIHHIYMIRITHILAHNF